MSTGPKKTFGVSLGYFWTLRKLRLANMHHQTEHFEKSLSVFKLFYVLFWVFQQFEQFLTVISRQHAPSYFCDTSGVVRNVLTNLKTLFSHFDKRIFWYFPIWNFPKCTVHSCDEIIYAKVLKLIYKIKIKKISKNRKRATFF